MRATAIILVSVATMASVTSAGPLPINTIRSIPQLQFEKRSLNFLRPLAEKITSVFSKKTVAPVVSEGGEQLVQKTGSTAGRRLKQLGAGIVLGAGGIVVGNAIAPPRVLPPKEDAAAKTAAAAAAGGSVPTTAAPPLNVNPTAQQFAAAPGAVNTVPATQQFVTAPTTADPQLPTTQQFNAVPN